MVLSLNDLAHFSVCSCCLGLSGQVILKALFGLCRQLSTFISIRKALGRQILAFIILFVIIKLLRRSFGLAVDLVCIIII